MAHTPVCVGGLSPYEILGVPVGASQEEARAAVRALALVLHPDVNPRGAGLFGVVQAAAECVAAGGKWQASAPTSSSAPRAPSLAWRISKKGNHYRRIGEEVLTVFLRDEMWWWVGPGAHGASEFSPNSWDTPEEAMADADDYFGEVGHG